MEELKLLLRFLLEAATVQKRVKQNLQVRDLVASSGGAINSPGIELGAYGADTDSIRQNHFVLHTNKLESLEF